MRARMRQPREGFSSASRSGSSPSRLLPRRAGQRRWMQAPRHSRHVGSWNAPRPRVTAVSSTSTAPDLVPPVRQPEPSSVQRTPYDSHRPLAPSPDCAWCLIPETAPHYLLACLRFRRQCLALILRRGTACLSRRAYVPRSRTPSRDTGRFPRYALSSTAPLFPFSFSFPIVHTLIIALFLFA
jgi:hypothetical protein